ncbi:MAG: MarC family protein [Sedimentisphaerales bacterium]|jgi:multiple antibiotic resistance protein
MLSDILHTFIPLFVAVDAFGVLPIFVSLTEGLDTKEKNRVVIQSIWTASVVAVVFILLGKLIFRFLGITIADFMIAGGAILFCISITDIINPTKKRRIPSDNLGSVPIGIPLIVGPAVLATSLVLESQYGLPTTIISVLLNILIASAVFRQSHRLITILGDAGSKALSKVMSLLLGAIAVMLIRRGIEAFLIK